MRSRLLAVLWVLSVPMATPQDERAGLLAFSTGSPRPPIGGFRHLRGRDGVKKLYELKLVAEWADGNVPVAHVGFNRIDVPVYSSRHALFDALAAHVGRDRPRPAAATVGADLVSGAASTPPRPQEDEATQ